MALDSVLHLRDIKLPEVVKALQDPDLIIASVKEIAEEETTEAAEAGTAEQKTRAEALLAELRRQVYLLLAEPPAAEPPAAGAPGDDQDL